MDDETSRLLSETDWGPVGMELTAHAIGRARNYDWRTGNSWELAMGWTPKDVAQEVITKTLSGHRKWDHRKGPLLPWLKDQVNSVMDALAWSASHRHEYYMPKDDEDSGSIRSQPSALKLSDLAASNTSLSPEESALREEESKYAAMAVNALFAAVDGDAESERVLDLVMGSCELKPRYIAQESNLPVDKVNNSIKRLRRKAIAIRKEMEDGEKNATRKQ